MGNRGRGALTGLRYKVDRDAKAEREIKVRKIEGLVTGKQEEFTQMAFADASFLSSVYNFYCWLSPCGKYTVKLI